MKGLLLKLTRSHVNIRFKSGEELDNVVIESVIGNILVANYQGKITLLDIGHIAFVSTETGVMEVIETILKNQQNTQEKKQDSQKD